MSNEKKETIFWKIFLIGVVALIVYAVFLTIDTVDNIQKENNFIENADCNSLEVYINAGREGKDYFAYWTMETQETVNFSITDKRVDKAQLKYHWECEKESEQ